MAIQGSRNWKRLVLIIGAVICIACLDSCDRKSSKEKYPISSPGGKTDPLLVKRLYDSKCAVCHGFDGRQQYAGAKDLGMTQLNRDQVINQIAEGKGTMPPQKDVLSEDQIAALADFVLSLKNK